MHEIGPVGPKTFYFLVCVRYGTVINLLFPVPLLVTCVCTFPKVTPV